MSKLSIYETGWINLVFEGKNKEYGAYQLRQESTRTSLFALFMGLSLLTSIVSIPMILNCFGLQNSPTITIPDFTNTPIQLSDIIPNELQNTEKSVLPRMKNPETEVPIQSDQLVNPVIVQASQANPDIAKNTENANTTTVITNGTANDGVTANASLGTGTEIPNAVDAGNTIVASVALDKLPEFPGGIKKFYSYVGNNFEKSDIEGSGTIQVYVSFVIEKDGSMTDIQVKKDPGYGLGKEAIRVLKSLKTKWAPGMIDSKAVRTAYNLPIIVELN